MSVFILKKEGSTESMWKMSSGWDEKEKEVQVSWCPFETT